MGSDVKDPAQELAESVARKWFGEWMSKQNGSEELAALITKELRAGAWVQLPAMIGRLEGALGTFAEKEMARLGE